MTEIAPKLPKSKLKDASKKISAKEFKSIKDRESMQADAEKK